MNYDTVTVRQPEPSCGPSFSNDGVLSFLRSKFGEYTFRGFSRHFEEIILPAQPENIVV